MTRAGIPITVALGLSFAGCSSIRMLADPSLLLDNQFGPSWNWNVENGAAYDRATVEPGTAKKVVLPDTAIIQRTSKPSPIRLFMEKRLGFAGHPTELWSIRDLRKNMGCAIKIDDGNLVIGTFGEFHTIEGGTYMRLVAFVPEGLNVELRKGLSGHNSAAESQDEGPRRPASGWQELPDEPDPDRTAQEQKD